MFLPVLIVSGIVLGAIGPAIEALLRTIYARDEAFQLLLTFALVLMFQDVLRFFWGSNPQQLGNLANDYGRLAVGTFSVSIYNLLVIPCEHRDCRRYRRLSATDALRAYPARHRREPRDEPGSRR